MDWAVYFERNRRERQPIPWEHGIAVRPELRSVLVRSLQRFQVGECGGGAHLRAVAREFAGPTYGRAINLFVQEEQEHARLLARAIQALGGQTLQSHWSDRWFTLLRRAAGLRTELLVLLTAELIGLRYYRALRDGIADPVLHALFTRIVRDEEAHIAFHCDTLQRLLKARRGPIRAVVRAAWGAFCWSVCAVVVLDHRVALRTVGVSEVAWIRGCVELMEHSRAQILNS